MARASEEDGADTAVVAGEIEAFLGVSLRFGNQRYTDAQRLAVAGERLGSASEVGAAEFPQHVPQLLVSRGQLELQRAIAARLARQPIEVLLGALDEELARLGRPGQVLDRIVDFEEEGVG